MIKTDITIREKLITDEFHFSKKYDDLEDEIYRVKTKDITGTTIDEYSLIPRSSRMYAWTYMPFPYDLTVKDISDWTEIGLFALQGIYYPANSVPLLYFDFHAIRQSGASGYAQFRVVLVGKPDGDVPDQTIFQGQLGSTRDRGYKEVYLSEIEGGTGQQGLGIGRQYEGWCIRIDVNFSGAATGITLYKQTSISLMYEF